MNSFVNMESFSSIDDHDSDASGFGHPGFDVFDNLFDPVGDIGI